MIQGSASPYSNFKMFKQDFVKKIEQVLGIDILEIDVKNLHLDFCIKICI